MERRFLRVLLVCLEQVFVYLGRWGAAAGVFCVFFETYHETFQLACSLYVSGCCECVAPAVHAGCRQKAAWPLYQLDLLF